MPRLSMDAPTYELTAGALRAYQRELQVILHSVEKEALTAGARPDVHRPLDVGLEERLAQECLLLVASSQQDARRVIGVHFSDAHAALIASALVLTREDLSDRLQAIEADPLAHPATAGPVRGQIARIDGDLEEVWHQYGYSPLLPELQRRRAIQRGLAVPAETSIDAALQAGEGQGIEFIERYPSNGHELAKEIAAFATSNAGAIFLGVSDAGQVPGLQEADDLAARDALRRRIEGLSSGAIKPSVVPRIDFLLHEGHDVVRIGVPKGTDPVYYTNHRPYMRHGTLARPAEPHEVIHFVEQWLNGRQTRGRT